MVSENMLIKLADEHIKFLQSPLWQIIQYRWREYQDRQRGHIDNNIRQESWNTVSRLQGGVDTIPELIKITEGLVKEIKENSFDVDGALHVIENK